MHFEYSKTFKKQFDKIPPKIKTQFYERLKIFSENKNTPILDNHSLSGPYYNHRSINITGDYRLIYEEVEDGEVIPLKAIGTHSRLYE
jgi:addiction module RelE/StbE family toxin